MLMSEKGVIRAAAKDVLIKEGFNEHVSARIAATIARRTEYWDARKIYVETWEPKDDLYLYACSGCGYPTDRQYKFCPEEDDDEV